MDWPIAAVRGDAEVPRAEYTPSVETAGRSTAVLGGESWTRVFGTRVPALAPH